MIKKLIPILIFASAMLLPAVPKVEGVGDLKKLQEKVQKVVRAATGATVSLVSPTGGRSGSGVIISADGLILTAGHVIKGMTDVIVIFPDGREEKAKVLGANFTRDAAMVQLVGEGPWSFVKVADSDSMEVGEYVVAMGHPKGYDPTRRPPVRFGRIMTKKSLGFITTDCTLIGGDSGGPLFDLKGRVVGIHSNINAEEREINNHAGITGFKRSWVNMLAGKSWGILRGDRRNPDRPVMGVNLRKRKEGLVVAEVSEAGPAFQAGFKVGDMVTTIAGLRADKVKDLSEIFVDLIPDTKIQVVMIRDGKEITKTVKLARLADIYLSQRR